MYSTAWHAAAQKGNLEAFDILWIWGKETGLNPDDILLAQTEGGYTLLHLAADGNYLDKIHKMWVCAD